MVTIIVITPGKTLAKVGGFWGDRGYMVTIIVITPVKTLEMVGFMGL